ncbi:MAG: hypothetical protein AAGC71_11905 [Pseudomonadota bacterium]
MASTLLSDRDIVQALITRDLQVTGLAGSSPDDFPLDSNSPIQPSSIDLRVGKIMLPTKEIDDKHQNSNDPQHQKSIHLETGQTAVVETLENISLSSSLSAFGFPPARLSRDAVLMTNPGHVDPGFEGKLSFTLINMGREKKYLEEGMDLVSLLVFKLEQPVQKNYKARKAAADSSLRRFWPTLNQLAPDFLDIDRRTVDGAKTAVEDELESARKLLGKAESKLEASKIWVPALAGLATAFIGIVGTYFFERLGEDVFASSGRVQELETTVEGLEQRVQQLGQLENELRIDERLDDIERRLSSPEGEQ